MRRWLGVLLALLVSVTGLTVVAATRSTPAAAATPAAGAFVTVTPARIADTRTGYAGNPRRAIPARGALSFQVAGKGGVPTSGAGSAVVSITAIKPTASGFVTSYQAGAALPPVITSFITAGVTVTTAATVKLSASGAINVYNRSAAPLHVLIDVSGYYLSGSATAPAAYVPLGPVRLVDTTTGVNGNPKGRLATNGTITAQITGKAGVPADVSAVVATVSAYRPTGGGWLQAWGGAGTITAAAVARASASDLVQIRLSPSGKLNIKNATNGTLDVFVDVVGYFRSGVPTQAGLYGLAGPATILDTRTGVAGNRRGAVPAKGTINVGVTGRFGVPTRNVRAVVGYLTAYGPTGAGSALMYRAATARPNAANLSFRSGASATDLAVIPIASNGQVALYNNASVAVHYLFAVVGYYLYGDLPAPKVSVSHYVRSVSSAAGKFADATATGVGCADAQNGASFVLLDIGAQKNDATGVLLTVVNTSVTYASLVAAINAYLTSYAKCGDATQLTLALGTNNDANDWTHYPASQRGADWANNVVKPVLVANPGVKVYGADDIEAGFFSTQAQAQAWESAFLSADPSLKLVYNGSADGCPVAFGATGACNWGWTQQQYYTMAYGLSPGRILALPQIYFWDQAVQWANISATGGDKMMFAGALTEFAADGLSYQPTQGWAALNNTLAWRSVTPPSLVTDLDVLT